MYFGKGLPRSSWCEEDEDAVGVAGSIFTDARGERGDLRVTEEMDADDVEEALEWDLLWKERMLETEEDVEFRPPRVPERRYDDLGVSGCGEREFRLCGGGVARCVVM